ncbi:MAG TPA: methyltransferase [Vicinamibacterales bacterium]|nr:methyltransferase [Vicinamibacterales bacterium]
MRDAGRLRDLGARAAVGALFALLSVSLLNDFVRTGRVTGLLLLVSEALVVVLMVVRRRTDRVDRSTAAAIVTAMSLAGPPLLRPADDLVPLAPDLVTAILSGAGLLVVIVGKIALGRSFGIVPANRGVVAGGPYSVVRHPIYAGYLLTHVAFVMAHPRAINAAIVIVADAALIVRALMEERVMAEDAQYRVYCRRVEWHLVPGVF